MSRMQGSDRLSVPLALARFRGNYSLNSSEIFSSTSFALSTTSSGGFPPSSIRTLNCRSYPAVALPSSPRESARSWSSWVLSRPSATRTPGFGLVRTPAEDVARAVGSLALALCWYVPDLPAVVAEGPAHAWQSGPRPTKRCASRAASASGGRALCRAS